MLVELQEAKKHLVIDPAYRGDDDYIISLIDTAIETVGLHINRPLRCIVKEYGYLPSMLKTAVLLLVGNLYANREPVAYEEVKHIPYTYEYLLSMYLKIAPDQEFVTEPEVTMVAEKEQEPEKVTEE